MEKLRITLIAVGKLKESYLVKGINEYLKRLRSYASVEIIEVKDEPHGEIRSDREADLVMQREAERILAVLPGKSYVIALDIRGKNMTSEELADKMASLALEGTSSVTFVIGGSLGLHSSVIKRADLRLSFSKFTFPHQLMRLILVEQVYRAFTIMRGEPYHK